MLFDETAGVDLVVTFRLKKLNMGAPLVQIANQ